MQGAGGTSVPHLAAITLAQIPGMLTGSQITMNQSTIVAGQTVNRRSEDEKMSI